MRSFLPSARPVLVPAALTAALALGGAPACSALDLNGFFPARGEGDLALSVTRESYDEFWAGTRKVSNPGVGEVETTSVALWMRWGVTDDLALIADLPWVDAASDGLGGFSDSGVQDLSLAAQYRFARLGGGGPVRHSFSGALGVRTALGDYEANRPVSLGDGSTDVLARLVYQLEGDGFYFSQQIGYDLRGGDVPDGFPLYSELGYTAGRVTTNAFYLRYVADGGTDIGDPGFTFPSNQDETERLGLKVFVRAGERFGFSLGGFTTLSGRNSGDATGYTAGFVTRF
jgi:hypothetical protein